MKSDLPSLLKQLDRLAAEINESWPAGISAEEAIRDVRRELLPAEPDVSGG